MISKKLTLTALMATALFFAPIQSAKACFCELSDNYKAQEDAFKKFDIVATVEILDNFIPENYSEPQIYKLRTIKAIKGTPKDAFSAYDFEDTSCGNFFKIGDVQTLGFDRQTGNKFVIYSECDQLLLDSYLAGDVNLNGAPGIPLYEDHEELEILE